MRSIVYRRKMKRQKVDRLRNIIVGSHTYAPHIGYIDYGYINGQWQPIGNYIKYPKNSNKQKFLKKQTNKRIRRAKVLVKGNAYRKYLDYWWEMY